MKHATFFACLFIAFLACPAQNATFQWADQFGGTTGDFSYALAFDMAENILVTGSFDGTVDFDPGPGTSFMTSSAGAAFVCKLDPAGNFLWARQFGSNIAVGYAIDLDTNDFICITGSFSGSGDFDPGSGSYTLTGNGPGENTYALKLNPVGDLVWANVWGSAFLGSSGYGIASDGAGNAYVTGFFQGTVDFDPGPGSLALSSNGGIDLFISKFDAVGGLIWAPME